MKNKLAFHGHVEEAYLRYVEKKLKEKRAALGINPCIRDLYLKVESGEAKSGAPISPILSPYGLNVADFVNQFNKRSNERGYNAGVKIPVIINVYENKTTKFKLTALYTFYIISGNTNKYKIYKLLDLYKRLKLIQYCQTVGEKRVWSTIDELYRKPLEIELSLINPSTRKVRKQKKIFKRNKSNATNDEITTYKTMLATLMGTKSIVYLRLKHYYISGLTRLKERRQHDACMKNIRWELLGENNRGTIRRRNKLQRKVHASYIKWHAHKGDYYKIFKYRKLEQQSKGK